MSVSYRELAEMYHLGRLTSQERATKEKRRLAPFGPVESSGMHKTQMTGVAWCVASSRFLGVE